MSVEDVLLELVYILLISGFFGALTIAANLADRDRNRTLRNSVLIVLLIINGVLVVALGLLRTNADESLSVEGLIVTLLVSGLATALLFPDFRNVIARFFPHLQQKPKREESDQPKPYLARSVPDVELKPQPGQPLFPQMLNYYTTDTQLASVPNEYPVPISDEAIDRPMMSTGFNPQSVVHTVALVFIVYMLGLQFITFAQEGGLSGVAENLEGTINGWTLVINILPMIIVPILGVGFLTRRTLPETLDRLGLSLPSAEGLAVSAAVTIGLFIFVVIISGIWMEVVSEETYQEQTEASEALAGGVTTVGLAFLLAMVAAVSEELAFRGAMQPVFGFWPTAIIFALTHIQYTLTPAWFIILVVAVGFGWIRSRYNTTVAMFTHFTYNFIPLVISVYVSDEAVIRLLHWLH